MGSTLEILQNEQWKRVIDLLPEDWDEQAFTLNALGFIRKFDPESLLRVSLLYLLGPGSERIASAQAHFGGIVSTSSIAFHNRFRKAGPWLEWLGNQIMQSNLASLPPHHILGGRRVRLVDATTIQPPGSIGTGFRLHVSMIYPGSQCNEIHATTDKTGESFVNFSVQSGDLLIGDRAYGTAAGVAHVVDREGDVLVRINCHNMPLWDDNDQRISILPRLKGLHRGRVRQFDATVRHKGQKYAGRVVARRLPKEVARANKAQILRDAKKHQRQVRPETLEAQEYAIYFTTLSPYEISGRQVAQLYLFRWPVEILFKRLKSIFEMDELRAKGEESALAWIHGKLLIMALTDALNSVSGDFPPLGREMVIGAASVRVAGVGIFPGGVERMGPTGARHHREKVSGGAGPKASGGLKKST